MAKQKHIQFRRRVLNRCLRNQSIMYTLDDLLDVCNRALTAKFGADAQISRRTLQYELNEIEVIADFVPNLRIGHKRVYRYENPNFNYRGDDESLTDEELETLDKAIDVLREADYGDKPQFAYVRAYLEMIKTENADTSNISFQSSIDLTGLEHFDDLMTATIGSQTINITYQPYGKDEREIQLSPYQLKQYNDRWFLVGKVRKFDGISVFSIDRIKSVDRARFKFQPPDIDLDEYFDDVVGITVPDTEVEKVVIKVNNKRYPYIKTKPIHYSQKELHELCTDEYTVIQLCVKLNKELESQLLSYGSDIEVLAPESLRKLMKDKIQLMMTNYS